MQSGATSGIGSMQTGSRSFQRSNVELLSTSGYDDLDAKMIELIKAMPGTWNPAENADGNNVEQSFVLIFGAMGC